MSARYAGAANLEVMEGAHNYNAYLLRLIRQHIGRQDRILDFGAGTGTFAKALSAAGYAVRCVEPDGEQAASIVRAGLPVVESLEEVADQSLDCLYTLNVLEHIQDDVKALRLCFAKLKPGGRMLIYVPAFQLLYSSMDRKVGHFRRYTRQDLGDKVRRAGLAIDDSRYVDSLGFFAALAYRAVGHGDGHLSRHGLVLYDRLLFPLSRVADVFLHRLLGKNVFLAATRPA